MKAKAFQSTPSARRATSSRTWLATIDKFQSTPSARRATAELFRCRPAGEDFNPRPPRGGRPLRRSIGQPAPVFQSTPSARRATGMESHPARFRSISIHALREEGDAGAALPCLDTINFNPRPPRGGRHITQNPKKCKSRFQSTPSARRATRRLTSWGGVLKISIHALREEGDQSAQEPASRRSDFNPRPPRGGRQQKQRKNPPRLFHYTHLCTI